MNPFLILFLVVVFMVIIATAPWLAILLSAIAGPIAIIECLWRHKKKIGTATNQAKFWGKSLLVTTLFFVIAAVGTVYSICIVLPKYRPYTGVDALCIIVGLPFAFFALVSLVLAIILLIVGQNKNIPAPEARK